MDDEVLLQVWRQGNGQWAGRILRNGEEDGRVEDLDSAEDVELQAMEVGLVVGRVVRLDSPPRPA